MYDAFEIDSPLATVGIRALRGPANPTSDETGPHQAPPLALRKLKAVPDREVPAQHYDSVRQIAVTPDGRPLTPNLKKEWTSYESTHTDGDGGDNENWGWEEQ